jgi:uncharacterized protein
MPLIIDIKVVPNAGKAAFKIDKGGQLKCYLKNPAEQGKANKELIKLLAKSLKIAPNNIVIITGKTSRKKRIRIDQEITLAMLLAALGIDWQYSVFDK